MEFIIFPNLCFPNFKSCTVLADTLKIPCFTTQKEWTLLKQQTFKEKYKSVFEGFNRNFAIENGVDNKKLSIA